MSDKQSLAALLQELADRQTDKVKLAITDIDGILRGKVISFEKFRSVAEKGFGFCDVVFGWDAGDVAYDNGQFTGWHTGYPDAQAVVDLATFRRVPWENGLPFFLADFKGDTGAVVSPAAVADDVSGKGAGESRGGSSDPDASGKGAGESRGGSSDPGASGKGAGGSHGDPGGKGLYVCPRSLLKKVRAEALSEGYSAVFSQEFEWYNFIGRGNELPAASYKELKPMSEGMFGYSILRASQGSAFFHDLFDLLKQFGVPLEGIHTETGPGVYEAAIQYGEILDAADRAVLFKSGVKEIAHRHGVIPTFMAKFNENLPGCSGHVHQSLWAADGSRNLFYDAVSATGMSALMESYIAGQLACLPYVLPMYAPTVNSYKRLVEGAWAPTTLTWAIDNRTTALRALPGGASSTRLETRVVGSDSNPYLAMAACLASGLYGIRKKLRLDTPETKGSGYADKSRGVLPRNLWEATQAMKSSPIATGLFGADFVDHFARTREWEWRQFSREVTDWELKRYFEII